MKTKEPLLVCVLVFIMLVVTNLTGAERQAESPDSGTNLEQKMFTLSSYGGGLTLFAPYMYPPGSVTDSTTSYPTEKSQKNPTRSPTQTTPPPTRGYLKTTTTYWPYTTTRYYPWTTAPPTRGVSVCLRLITSTSNPSIFTLSPSSTPLSLQVTGGVLYLLRFGSNQVTLRPTIPIWSNIGRSMWTSICLTVDFTKNVVQMFSNMNMSSRKLLMYGYRWSAEPVITFSGFDGQLTDVQVWDYPLRYKEVFFYMSFYRPVQGSLLSWSNIRYSLQGRSLLEDSYEWQMKQPISKKKRGRVQKGEAKVRKDFKPNQEI
ncbi:uncharacterized protein LOC112140651 isoform X2 [Oryzias melastigma]|uniref:uncharacterized protein LOC112140651 isoform X2 n=1 Tax=Oryzias melastigma TaxID=30732 RepID=UPI000CF83A86|nr:uncharacterized protein LOC112140651 isoform X2 [Oryzias melastigma]